VDNFILIIVFDLIIVLFLQSVFVLAADRLISDQATLKEAQILKAFFFLLTITAPVQGWKL